MTGLAMVAIALMGLGIVLMIAGLFKASGQIERQQPNGTVPPTPGRPKGYAFIAIGLLLLLAGYLIFTQVL
jgi:hypothetical protein